MNMMRAIHRTVAALSLLALPWQIGCVQPECSTVDYTLAECRVVAENDVARLRLPSGVEIRFQDPDVTDDETWDARGLLQVLESGQVRARVAGPGRFAISIDPGEVTSGVLGIVVDNVDPDALVTFGATGTESSVPPPDPVSLSRAVNVDLSVPGVTWIRGDRSCPSRYRLALLGDIQTNPDQFQRILERLQIEAEDAEAASEPLVGLVILGDLTESSRDDEFRRIDEMLRTAPVPVATTAGNHDIYRRLRPHYNVNFGPGNHVFEVCATKMVLLDSGSGAIARSVEARLPELLDKSGADHLLVGMHHPPYAALTGSGWSMEDRAQHLLTEAALADADLILAGHNHALHQYTGIAVGDVKLEEIVVGTGGAYQGLGVPRYGYLRLTLSDEGLQRCFVEVPPPGFAETPNSQLSDRLPYCDD
jgi:predicted phosphodiesterase